MRPTNKWQNLYSHKILFLSTSIVLLLFVISCQRTVEPMAATKDSATDAAKEWWYGTFRKSPEYFKIDRTSVLAPPPGSSTKKYPDWKRATSYSIGRLQIIELPLIYETNSILLPGMQKLYNTPEGARIAKSAIHKLMLIKKANGNMIVRTITLVPSAEYAQQNNYDISHISLKKLPLDFSGQQMVGGWDESEKGILQMRAGKPVKKLKIFTAVTLPSRKPSGNIVAKEVCDEVWVPHFVWVCVIVPSGDKAFDDERCKENGHWVEQGGTYEYVCREVEDDDYDDDDDDSDPCEGLSQEECDCMLYDACGDEEEEEEENCVVAESAMNIALSSGIAPNGEGSIRICTPGFAKRTKCYNWTVYKFSSGALLPCVLKSQEEAVQVLGADSVWRFESLQHMDMNIIGTTILYSLEVQQAKARPTTLPDVSGVANQIGFIDVSCVLKCSAICRGFPYSKNIDVANSNQWHVNE